MLLFPNPLPRKHKLTILLSPGENGAARFYLLDNEGIEKVRIDLSLPVETQQIQLSLPPVPPGMYQVKLEYAGRSGQQRLLIY